jgi:phytoene synthase
MATDLARAYRACARTTRRTARNFYLAFLSLPRAQRRAIYALYAFCREADDCADDDSDDLATRRTGLEELRDRLARAANGTPETERDVALADAIARYGVREEDLRDVLTGIEMDLTSTRIEAYDELRTYCYHVASAVGLATLPILTDGAPPTETLREAAVDLGLGMQYVNILRDVDEDLALGRIYLPRDELAAHGVDEAQLRARTMSTGLHAALAAHGDRAGAHLARGRRLLAHLPRRSRTCPWLLSEIYGRILARIVEADYRVFGGRVSLPAIEKLWLLLSSTWRRV